MLDTIIKLLTNFKTNPKTTIMGLVGGSTSASAVYMIIQQAGCNFMTVHWGAVLAAFVAPVAVGTVAADSHSPDTKTRASDPPPPVINSIPPKP